MHIFLSKVQTEKKLPPALHSANLSMLLDSFSTSSFICELDPISGPFGRVIMHFEPNWDVQHL